MEKRYICAFPTPPTLPLGLCVGAEVLLVAPLGPDPQRWLVAADTDASYATLLPSCCIEGTPVWILIRCFVCRINRERKL